MNYAVNVADLLYPDMKAAAAILLTPVTASRTLVQVDKDQPDSSAVVLECHWERAQAIIDLLRVGAKNRGRFVRCYEQGPRGGWKEMKR